jgi:glycosyltransferase involved in cell wall biosynthesis
MDLKVSIITTTYNSASTIESTLRSVLEQTYPDIEYWIIDGKSTDDTMDVVRRYEPSFSGRMHWISEEDAGLYDALNKGIQHSTGDVVGILNSDDFFTSCDVIERMVREFEDGLDAVYGDIHFVNPKDLSKCVRYYSSKKFCPWKMRFGYMPAHPSFYARRTVFENYGLYSKDYKIASDYDMMVRLFCKYKINAKYIPMDFVTMRVGGLSTRSLSSRLTLTHEDAIACRRNGVYSNFFLCSFKYLTKMFEFL